MIINCQNKQIDVDEEMVVVIKELNRLGLKTVSCCAGHPENSKKGKMAQLAFDAKDCCVLVHSNRVSINWYRSESN